MSDSIGFTVKLPEQLEAILPGVASLRGFKNKSEYVRGLVMKDIANLQEQENLTAIKKTIAYLDNETA